MFSEKAERVKAPATKPRDLSFIHKAHVVEGEDWL